MTLQNRQVLEPGEAPQVRPAPPYVCYGILAGCVAMFFLDPLLNRVEDIDGQQVLLQIGALNGPLVREGQWWRVLLTVFEHGGSSNLGMKVLHLGLNMSVLWTLGRGVERLIGSRKFAIASLVTALGSSAFALIFSYYGATVGASGMILGWAGVLLPISSREGRRALGGWLLQIAVISLLPGISWQGHLGGFLFGLPVGFSLRAGRGFSFLAPALVAGAALFVAIAGWGVFQVGERP